ncbi:tetratricopeptide repeat protein [Arcobacter vandammei]|uniref:tetratricopeptide repeat protein n=1 Tax=Arcobacter vandammei TaxID=2782243 RepID=UPI0018DF4DCD|nr:tetratricopeptide repeat protein [Arcobacter vandammei]
MTKYFLSLLVVSSISVAEEVSVYGNSSSSSYGLSSTEKHIMKNQSNISDLSSKVGDLKSLVDSINNRLEGLESTSEGDSKRLNATSKKVDDLISRVNSSSLDVDSSSSSSNQTADSDLTATVNNLKASVTKLTALVNKINSEYVSSNELEKNMKQFITREEFEALKKSLGVKTQTVTPTKSSDKKDTAVQTDTTVVTAVAEPKTAEEKSKFMAEAKKDYDAKNYNSALPKYQKLVDINYKPAESNFYLAEMWYVRKKYDVAINHFKKSAMLNDKAAYMPTLLLHSAISFENTKDNENAKNFYSTLIDLYPNSSQAKDAKTRLSKIK